MTLTQVLAVIAAAGGAIGLGLVSAWAIERYRSRP
jgi:hypothetical protein